MTSDFWWAALFVGLAMLVGYMGAASHPAWMILPGAALVALLNLRMEAKR
jgi:hypothetical protein